MQNPPGPQEGRVREPSLQALLRELAAFNKGLCVITTRMPVADIVDHEATSARAATWSITPAVSCLCFEALSEWHLGEIASCQATMAESRISSWDGDDSQLSKRII